MASKGQCRICGENADAVHFGAISCRACAAFFRRKVAGDQRIVKRCEGRCSLQNQVLRRLCASCRFEKCLMMGMRETAVLSKASESPVTSSKSILEELKIAYENLRSARRTTFRKTNELPKLCNYKEMNEMFLIDVKLIFESLVKLFQSKVVLEKDQEKLLAAHFMFPFCLMDGAYRWADSDVYILPNGDFVDIKNLEMYYQNPEESDDEKAELSRKMLTPYWKLNKQVLRQHLSEVRLDVSEFLLITALIYWDFGLQDQSDECIEICKRMRTKILEELAKYEKENYKDGDDSMRVGEIMMVLQTVQKSLNIMHECREVAMVYDLYGRDCPLFEMSSQ